MVQIVGLMVGCYIIVRMVSFITRKGEREETTTVKVLSILNVMLTVVLLMALLFSGASK
jgi:hypothetical protein